MTSETLELLTGVGAIACFLMPVYEVFYKKKTFTGIHWLMCFIGAYLFALGIGTYHVKTIEKAQTDSTIEADRLEIKNLRDTLKTMKDSLIKIGLRIDEKTGKLLVLDSQLLKKKFINVFNIKQITNEAPESITEEFAGSPSMSITLAHIPIEGSETFAINGIYIAKRSWKRIGKKVEFSNFGFDVDASDLITANYSYYE